MRLVILDDHLITVEGLVKLLDQEDGISVVGQAVHRNGLFKLLQNGTPDVLLIDIDLGNDDGMSCLEDICLRWPALACLVLTMRNDDKTVVRALDVGASGYLTKDTPSEKVVETVKRVYREGNILEPLLADRLLDEFTNFTEKNNQAPEAGLFASLSPRENEILKLVAGGRPNKLIAAELKISEHTVRNHISNIFQKLQVNNRTEATVLAMKRGLV